MSHIRVWMFRPPAERLSEFAEAYGPDGHWPRIFRRAEGFLGTELLRPSDPNGWWLTIDRWTSAEAFLSFERDLGDEYRAADRELEGLAGEERFVGAYETQDDAAVRSG